MGSRIEKHQPERGGGGGLMEAKQRTAALEAVLFDLGEKGYADCSPERVLAENNTSAPEVGVEPGDGDGVLFAAYEELRARVLASARSACASGGAWPERVGAGLSALLEEIAAKPTMAMVATRAFPGIGPSAYQLYVDLLSEFEPLLREGRGLSGAAGELPSEVELLAVGAAESIIFSEVDAGRAGALPRMLPEILFSILVPFLGPDRAAEEMRIAAAVL